MTCRFRFCVLLTCTTLCLLVTTAFAQGQGADCRNLVANHTYATYFQGFLNVPQFFQLGENSGWGDEPNAGIGTFTFFPDGTVKHVQTVLVGLLGASLDEPSLGSYSLSWDSSHGPAVCSGTLTEAEGSSNFQLVVSQNGQRIELMHTDAGLAVNPTGVLMNASGCTNKSIEGTYTYNTKGWGLLPVHVPAELTLGGYVAGVMSGAMRFYPGIAPTGTYAETPPQGAATVKGWDVLSMNGQIIPRTMEGWYKVNRDCSATVVLNDSMNPEFILEAYVGKGGDKVLMLNVNLIGSGDEAIPAFLMPIPLERAALENEQ